MRWILSAAACALALAWAVPGRAEPPPFTVAIDPGHGGSNVGAATLDPTQWEKHVTLDIALRLRQRLAREPGVKLILCRERDVMVPLRARVRCGNEARADLFISLHANASPLGPRRGTQRGFELYVLPVADVDREAAVATLAAPDDAAAAWAGHQVQAAAGTAVEAGRRIAWQLVDTFGADSDRGMKQQGALLDVLQGLRVPGLLLEVGFLDHPDEGRFLLTSAGREQIATALAKALTDLRARRNRGLTDPGITGTRK